MSRGPFRIVLRACLASAAAPTLVAALGAWAVARWQPSPTGVTSAGAEAPTLALPFLVAAFACSLRTIRSWPLFARGRPGADLLQRLQGGPLQGRGACIAGALAAQLLLTLPLALWLPGALGAPATAHATVTLTGLGNPRLDRTNPRVAFALPGGEAWQRIVLRPLAMLPDGPATPTRLALYADGAELAADLTPVGDTGQRIAAHFAPRPFRNLEVVRIDGTLPLYFLPGSVEATAAAGHGNRGNALVAAGLALLPTFLGLGCAAWVGLAAALPTVTLVATALVFVLTVGDLGPFGAAMRAVMRGEWLLGGEVFAAGLPLLALGSLAMALAMVACRRLRA